MDLMHLPWMWYFVDHRDVGGTYIPMGFIGLAVCCAAAYACWHQIRNENNPYN